MGKLIDLHYKWEEAEGLPHTGLCNALPKKYRKTLQLFVPPLDEEEELLNDDESTIFWGSGCHQEDLKKMYTYTLRRQYIVLFICAIHGEI